MAPVDNAVTARRNGTTMSGLVPAFSVQRQIVGDGIDLLKVSGVIDAHTFEHFDDAIQEVFSEGRFRLVLDMSDISYVSSAGAGVLIGSANEADANGGGLLLLHLPEKPMQLLMDLGLDNVLTTVEGADEALAAFE